VRANHDIIGGDSISAQNVTVQEGYSAAQVQRLVLIVGGLVFATALCFFIFGAISAAALVNVLARPLPNGSDPQAAAQMQHKLDILNSLPPGQEFQADFTEDEVSSYFRFILGPNIHISNGKARFLDIPGQIAISGNLDDVKGLPFIAQLGVTTENKPIQVEGAWVKLLPTPDGVSFGWVPVTPLAQSFETQLNQRLFGTVQFSNISRLGDTGTEVGIRALRLLGKTK
jgi:hypothetical protein